MISREISELSVDLGLLQASPETKHPEGAAVCSESRETNRLLPESRSAGDAEVNNMMEHHKQRRSHESLQSNLTHLHLLPFVCHVRQQCAVVPQSAARIKCCWSIFAQAPLLQACASEEGLIGLCCLLLSVSDSCSRNWRIWWGLILWSLSHRWNCLRRVGPNRQSQTHRCMKRRARMSSVQNWQDRRRDSLKHLLALLKFTFICWVGFNLEIYFYSSQTFNHVDICYNRLINNCFLFFFFWKSQSTWLVLFNWCTLKK